MSRLPYRIEVQFPNLHPSSYSVTSPRDMNYNCVSWAANTTELRCWPSAQGYQWPPGISQEETLESFAQFYALRGYEVCSSYDLEPEFEKIVIFCDDEGVPAHVARQLTSGKWTSKLGDLHDITHDDLRAVEIGYGYGRIRMCMKRRRSVP